jgi:two-component system, sensor histidine kinase and response regulator
MSSPTKPTFAPSKFNWKNPYNQTKTKMMANLFKKAYDEISLIGLEDSLSTYAAKRLLIFNRLNAFGFLLALTWFLYNIKTLINEHEVWFIFINIMPCVVGLVCAFLMYNKKYKIAIYTNFIITPLALSIATVVMHEGSILLFLLIYSVFPFFYNRKIIRIVLQFAYAITLYVVALYFLELNHVGQNHIFSPLFQAIGIVFLFITLYSIKVQVMLYEKLLNKSKVELDVKNRELNKLLQLKNTIFTVISHDIIVPLIGLKNMSTEIIKDVYEKEELKEIISLMNDEIHKTHDLFRNLLDWSKSQIDGKGEITTDININEISTRVIEQVYPQAEKKNIAITNKLQHEYFVKVNQHNILVALRNLLVNAIKFTHVGGQITLTSHTEEKTIFISITDTGIGIQPNKIKKIFSKEFYSSNGTNEERGNGFGLKICKELIQQNGGDVYCESSKIGEGSTFVIALPIGKSVNEYVLQDSFNLN